MKHLLWAIFSLALISCTSANSLQPQSATGNQPIIQTKDVIETEISYNLFRLVDREAGVVCYVYRGSGGGVDCVPFSQLPLGHELRR